MRRAPGRFGPYGGRYVPETLIAALDELAEAYPRITAQAAFRSELAELLASYAGRPTPLSFARRVTSDLGGAAVYLKREDLAHTGAHKINNVLGQCLLARAMGKRRVIAETGAGQHGVATATACALFGLECVVYMGAEDVERQALERLPHGAARRDGAARDERLADAEGRHQRGAAGLGDERARHLLLHRLGDGPASVSDDRARLPTRDRNRSAPPDPRGDRAAAGRAGGLRRRRLERDRALPCLPRRTPRFA